ncbi:hypothetical protein [Actinophytocola sediminis]
MLFNMALGFDMSFSEIDKAGETAAARDQVSTIVANVLQSGVGFQPVAPAELADEVVTILGAANQVAEKLIAGAPIAEAKALLYKPEVSTARETVRNYASQQNC